MRVVVATVLALLTAVTSAQETIRVASKNFNESYILGELMAQTLEQAGYEVERRFGLGGTLICYAALGNDEIDVYAEYTGTLAQAILGLGADAADVDRLNAELADEVVTLLPPFGFDNTYAMTLKADQAERLGLRTISDLRNHPELRVVVSHEFLERDDGWPGLSALYDLPHDVQGIEHALAYQAIDEGAIDITDAYSTDGELKRYALAVLEDDRQFFPSYLALPLIRDDLPAGARDALRRLAGTIDDAAMQRMNAAVVFEKRSFAEVASEHLRSLGVATAEATGSSSFWGPLGRNVVRHLQLTGIALGAAILVGLAAALAIYRTPLLARVVLYVCGLLQTVPSIALLALMIPLFGIGFVPAVVALFLYSLLPIVRNTVTALTGIDPVLVRVARAMGLSQREQLWRLYIPLSLPSIFAGVRTAAVISIGTATLAAFIGAGGLGDPIVTGLSLNDVGLILQGAVPAAGLAVLTELLFEGLESRLVPAHLRQA